MRNYKVSLALILCSIALTGCVQQYRQPLSLDSRKQIKADKLTTYTTQSQLQPESNMPMQQGVFLPVPIVAGASPLAAGLGAGVGGLIGGMITAEIEKVKMEHAQRDMKPLLVQLQGDDPVNQLAASLQQNLRSIKWLNVKSTTIKRNLTAQGQNSIAHYDDYKTNLVVSLAYTLNYQFTAMIVKVDVTLTNKDKTGTVSTLYKNGAALISYLPGKPDNRQAALIQWDANHAALAKSVLSTAAKLLPKAIAADISDPNSYAKMPGPLYSFRDDYGIWQEGKLVMRSGDYYLLRAKDGILIFVNQVRAPS